MTSHLETGKLITFFPVYRLPSSLFASFLLSCTSRLCTLDRIFSAAFYLATLVPAYFVPGFLLLSSLLPFRPIVQCHQWVTKRCRISWLTNSAHVYEPKCGGRGGGVAGPQPMSTAVHRSPNTRYLTNECYSFLLAFSLVGILSKPSSRSQPPVAHAPPPSPPRPPPPVLPPPLCDPRISFSFPPGL